MSVRFEIELHNPKIPLTKSCFPSRDLHYHPLEKFTCHTGTWYRLKLCQVCEEEEVICLLIPTIITAPEKGLADLTSPYTPPSTPTPPPKI